MSPNAAIRVLAACLFAGTALADDDDRPRNAATLVELPEVKVIGTTPLPGLGQPLANVPANVQSGTAKDIGRQNTLDLVDFLNNNLNGVNVNENQANPFQVDVNFRGFAASPRLGTPQGLSVYVDGVRVNESFGDVVNWDLIPESAIGTVTLVPGSNPTFGLNTLGGALSVQTKSGKQYPGTKLEAYGGSFGRRAGGFETGGEFGESLGGGFDYFLTGNWFDEDGWRDASPSHVRQLFGKLGWENDDTDFDLSYTFADNNLFGNSYTPESLLAARRKTGYTLADQTINHFNFVNGSGTHFLRSDLLLAGNLYYRQVRSKLTSGDLNDGYVDDYATAIAPGGGCDTAADPDACAAAALVDDTGLNNRSAAVQRRWGATLQLTSTARLFARDNSATIGAAWDDGRSEFTQEQQPAALTADRGTAAVGPYALDTSVYGNNSAYGLYVTDTFSPNALLHFTASGRYNGVRVRLRDRIGTTLNGRESFHRLNPAFGVTVTPDKALTLYANYNEGSRSPTPIELGCADPAIPCQLPNALASDPPLKAVIARTVEAGARGQLLGRQLTWSAAIYQTLSANDIQFISSTITGAGYFSNVGTTRRRGAELGLGGEWQRLSWHLNYSFVDATYRSPFQIVAPDNSSADGNGVITVGQGNRLPLIPRHTGRLVADYAVNKAWSVGANLVLSSGQYLLQNNNNLHRSGDNGSGTIYQGSGRAGAYAVMNLHADWTFLPGWTAFARIDNLLDRDYSTAGTLAANAFTPNGQFRTNPADWTEENAVSPAAPRSFVLGLRLAFDTGAH